MLIISQILLLVLLTAEFIAVITMILILASDFTSFIYGAPYVPIRKKLTKDLLFFGGLSADDIFYDLGSGDGRILMSAVRDFGIRRAIGYEIAPWPYLKSRFLIQRAGLGNDIDIKRKNFFGADLSQATFIYMYLFPRLVYRLVGKIAGECQSDTKVLCPNFPIDVNEHKEFKLIKTGNFGKITAYLYQKV